MFLVFDGIDGAGKSTQIEDLARSLRDAGRSVVTCSDPGSTGLGMEVRRLVLERSARTIGARSEMLLFMVARCQLVQEIIRPALENGQTVLCDRYELSTLVYQGHAGEVPLEEIRTVGQIATGGLSPAHTFILDLPAAESLARISRGLDRMESRGLSYLERVRNGFLDEARRISDRCTVLNAAQPRAAMAQQIRLQTERLLNSQRSISEPPR